jgi:hypothetical protein
LVLILAAFGICNETIMNMTGGNEAVNQGPHRGDAGSYSTENSEADSGSWRQYLNLSSDKEENADPSNAFPIQSLAGISLCPRKGKALIVSPNEKGS